MTTRILLAGVATLAFSAVAVAQRGTLVVSNMTDHTATIIDAATSRVLATVPTGEGPHEVTTSHDGRWALVTNYGIRGKPGNSITVIDIAAASVTRTIDLGTYQRPHGVAFLPGDTVFAVTSEASSVVVLVHFASGRVTKTLPTGGRSSHMLSASASGDRIIVGNIADHAVAVLSPATGAAPRIIPVARQPESVAITPDGNTAWVGSNRDSVVLVVDLRSGVATDTLRGFGLPYRVAVSRDGRRVVVTDPVKANVRVFDAATRRQMHTIQIAADSVVATAEVPGSPSPEGVALSPDGRWAFVTLQGRNRAITIDLDRGTIVRWAPTGVWSDGIAFSAVTR